MESAAHRLGLYSALIVYNPNLKHQVTANIENAFNLDQPEDSNKAHTAAFAALYTDMLKYETAYEPIQLGVMHAKTELLRKLEEQRQSGIEYSRQQQQQLRALIAAKEANEQLDAKFSRLRQVVIDAGWTVDPAILE